MLLEIFRPLVMYRLRCVKYARYHGVLLLLLGFTAVFQIYPGWPVAPKPSASTFYGLEHRYV